MNSLSGWRKWKAIAIGVLLSAASPVWVHAAATTSQLSRDAQPIVVLVLPNPRGGFNYPYLLKVPVSRPAESARSLIVETNNTGGLSDDLALHIRVARFAIEQGIGASVADALRAPFLMPVFPRNKSLPLEYTHALDRDTVLVKDGDLRRLDLQLLAMIDDAQKRLKASGYTLSANVLLVGFSASGTFANRFSLIHPKRVAAIAVGGINGIAMLPQDAADGAALQYPLGTADFSTLFGKPFDLQVWRKIPQFLFMGAQDVNDAAEPKNEDAYSGGEKALVSSVLGSRMLPDRWAAVERLYKSSGANAEFRTYTGIGHGTNRTINDEVASFLRQYLGR